MTCGNLSDLPTKLHLTTELNMIQDTLPPKLHGKCQLNLHEKTSLLISTRSYGAQAIQALMNNPGLVRSYDFILDVDEFSLQMFQWNSAFPAKSNSNIVNPVHLNFVKSF